MALSWSLIGITRHGCLMGKMGTSPGLRPRILTNGVIRAGDQVRPLHICRYIFKDEHESVSWPIARVTLDVSN